ncbi:tRNA lysidine(34) synthetase TilS [Aerococcaceae bacterium NML190073]|nr:tRNA lysidine(34) synthetase TilS [Aerococcaceae bacterium NML190073]
MEKLLRTVKAQLESWSEWHSAQTIVVAVSGGVDSMVLLKVMRDLMQLRQYHTRQLVIAHFNHHLRSDSQADADLVKRVAEQYGLAYFYSEWEVPATRNIEANAREARYAFFAEVMRAVDADVLMTAHHLNDVAETFMMRLTRGTSLKGIQGIRANYRRLFVSGDEQAIIAQVMRPLISIPKAMIRQFAEQFGVQYNEDVSNHSLQFMRNRFRHQYLPALEEENPQFIHHLLDLQKQLQASYATHYAEYIQCEPELLMFSQNTYWILYIPAFLALPKEKRQVFLTIFFEERLVEQVPDYRRDVIGQVEQMMLNKQEPNRRLQLGSQWVAVKRYDYLQLMPESYVSKNKFATALNIERENHWYQLDSSHRIGVFVHHQVTPRMKRESLAVLGVELTHRDCWPFTLRHRQAGDTMELIDTQGNIYHKKISRMMIDQKLSAEERERAWLLCENSGDIIWFLPNVVSRLYQRTQTDKITHIFLYQEIKQLKE